MDFACIFPYLMWYGIGFVISLVFLAKFGDPFKLDGYNVPKTSVNYGDYESTASAFFAVSIIWPLFYCIGAILWLYGGFIKLYKSQIK